MSGGSYNYLCYKESDRISEAANDIEEMFNRLSELDMPVAAQQTYLILTEIRKFNNKMDVLLKDIQGMWKAVEWCDSADTSIESVQKEYKKYLTLEE